MRRSLLVGLIIALCFVSFGRVADWAGSGAGVALGQALAPSSQCEGWLPSDPFPGLNNPVVTMVRWDPDGPGPETEKVVVGGSFSIVTDSRVEGVALYDPVTQTFSKLGPGIFGSVEALLVMPDNSLVVAGTFSRRVSGASQNIARWDGTAWSSLGLGTNGRVRALALLPGGDLVAGGDFLRADNTVVNSIARWNGTQWTPIGPPTNPGTNGSIERLAVFPNGLLLARGTFSTAGGVSVSSPALWNGVSWSPGFQNGNTQRMIVGGQRVFTVDSSRLFELTPGSNGFLTSQQLGVTGNSSVDGVAVMPNNDVVITGGFSTINGVPAFRAARWNGTTWSPMGEGPTPAVSPLVGLSNGDVIAATTNSTRLLRWNGATWTLQGSFDSTPLFNAGAFDSTWGVRTISLAPDGNYFVGGTILRPQGGSVATGVGLFRTGPNAWADRSVGFTAIAGGTIFPEIRASIVLPDGSIIAGGSFRTAAGTASNIARWNGTAWSALGTGTNGSVNALLQLPNGDIIVGGAFTTAGGLSANGVARWNGAAWFSLARPAAGEVLALLRRPNGDLITAGITDLSAPLAFRGPVLQFDGTTWSRIGPAENSAATAMAEMPDGTLVIAGLFEGTGSVLNTRFVRRWSGSSWQTFGVVNDATSALFFPISSMTFNPAGDLIVAGRFDSIGPVFIGNPVNVPIGWNMALFRNGVWSPMPGGSPDRAARSMTWTPDGDLLVGGSMTFVGDRFSALVARYRFPGSQSPGVVQQPQSQTVIAGQTLTLSLRPVVGRSAVTVQWQRNGVNITDGPGGASSGGGVVSNANGTLPSPSTDTPITMFITGITQGDAGSYTAVLTNPCGTVTTAAATINITPPPCTASDVAGPNQAIGADGELTADDIIVYLGWFFATDPRADVAGPNQSPTPDTQFTADDIIVFLGRYFAGC